MDKYEKVFSEHFPNPTADQSLLTYWLNEEGHKGRGMKSCWANYVFRFEQLALYQKPHVYHKTADIAALEDIARTSIKLERLLSGDALTLAAKSRLNARIHYGHYADDMPCDDPEALREHLFEAGIADGSDPRGDGGLRDYMDETGIPLHESIVGFLKQASALENAVSLTKRDIKVSLSAVRSPIRLNLDAIQCVEAARIIWNECHEKSAPEKALNPASPFGKFLSALFVVYEINASPKSAFGTWAKRSVLQKS